MGKKLPCVVLAKNNQTKAQKKCKKSFEILRGSYLCVTE
jgi:hypothetical protein